jgi:transcriptional regulatory protein RtcR
MATLADAGRITAAIVSDETRRLKRLWHHYATPSTEADGIDLEEVLGRDQIAQMDLFDVMQLKAVIEICRRSKSMSDAGRKLFAASRSAKEKPNDADRLKKYLAKFGLNWERLNAGGSDTIVR